MQPSRESWRRRRRVAPVVVSGLVVLTALVAAGSATGRSEKAGARGADAATRALIEQAKAQIAAAGKPLSFTPPGPSIDVSKLKGKSVLVVSVDQRIPALAEVAAAVQEAGPLAGIKVGIFDAKSDVSRMLQGVQQAIREDNAVILLGIPIALVGGPLKQAAKAKVPAVSVLNNEPRPNAPGQGAGDPNVYASTAPSYFKGGQLVADKAVIDTGGKANVVIFNTSEITPAKDVVAGQRSVYGRCTTCKVKLNDTPLAQWATKLTPKAESEIRRDGSVNYLTPIFDGMAIFVTAGVDQAGAGSRVKVAAFNATPAALQLIQNGATMTADPGQPNGWTGWAALDQAMRGMLGLKPANPEVPIRYFDKANLKGVNVKSEAALFGDPDFRGGFKKLWGLAK